MITTQESEAISLPKLNDPFVNTTLRSDLKGPYGIVHYLDTEQTGVNEDGYPELSLRTKTKFLETENFRIEAKYNPELLKDLHQYNIDAKMEILSQLRNEDTESIHQMIYKIYSELGQKHSDSKITKWKRFLFKLGIKNVQYTQDPIKTCLLISNKIAAACRRGPGNFVIVNTQVLVYLQDNPSFVFQRETGIPAGGAFRLVGSVGDKISVFLNPWQSFDDCSIVMGRTSQSHEPGVFFGEYSADIQQVDTFNENKYLLHRRMMLSPVGDSVYTHYLKENLVIGKKPFWRKVLGL